MRERDTYILCICSERRKSQKSCNMRSSDYTGKPQTLIWGFAQKPFSISGFSRKGWVFCFTTITSCDAHTNILLSKLIH